jgi:CRP-like cAMP-binding protein
LPVASRANHLQERPRTHRRHPGHPGRRAQQPTLGRGIQVKLTHEQLAALAGTSRQTTTKILNEYADLGLVSLGRGRINILDHDRMRRAGGL